MKWPWVRRSRFDESERRLASYRHSLGVLNYNLRKLRAVNHALQESLLPREGAPREAVPEARGD